MKGRKGRILHGLGALAGVTVGKDGLDLAEDIQADLGDGWFQKNQKSTKPAREDAPRPPKRQKVGREGAVAPLPDQPVADAAKVADKAPQAATQTVAVATPATTTNEAKKEEDTTVKNKMDKVLELKGTKGTGTTGTAAPFNAFWPTVNAAKLITTERPREEQPTELAKLMDLLGQLNEKSKKDVMYEVMNQCIKDALTGNDEGVKVQAVFPIAFAIGRRSTAYNAAALCRAIREDKLTLDDLDKAELTSVWTPPNGGKARLNYRVELESLKAAALKLKAMGKSKAAAILSSHVFNVEVALRTRAASKSTATESDATDAESASTDAAPVAAA